MGINVCIGKRGTEIQGERLKEMIDESRIGFEWLRRAQGQRSLHVSVRGGESVAGEVSPAVSRLLEPGREEFSRFFLAGFGHPQTWRIHTSILRLTSWFAISNSQGCESIILGIGRSVGFTVSLQLE